MANNPYVNKVVVNNQAIIDLTGDTVTPAKLLDGYTAHDKSGAPITGNIQSLAAQTITPALTEQEIAAGKYLSGNQTIAPITASLLTQLDPDFAAENIKKDVNLFGLVGNLEGVSAAYGTFTPSGGAKSYTIDHNLGMIPDFVAFFASGYTPSWYGTVWLYGCAFADSKQINVWLSSGNYMIAESTRSMYDVVSGSTAIAVHSVTASKASFGNERSSLQFRSGATYRWVVAKF